MNELLDRHVLNLPIVLEHPSAEFPNQPHNMDDPSHCSFGFNRGELTLLPCSIGVCLREKNKKEKKERGFLLQDFSRSNMQSNNWVQSKKQLNCLSGVCNNLVLSKKQHLSVCLESATTQCSQKSHT
jgi:hypothetical protein